MKKIISLLLLLVLSLTIVEAQVVSSTPEYPTVNDEVVISFNLNKCECNLQGYTGDIYAHTGVITSESNDLGDWKNVIAEWSENISKAKLVRLNDSIYTLTISPNGKSFYALNESTKATKFAFVFRSSDGGKQTANLYADIYQPGLSVVVTDPEGDLIVEKGDSIQLLAETVSIGTSNADSISLYVDNVLKHVSKNDTLNHKITASSDGTHWIKIIAKNDEYTAYDSIFYFVRSEIVEEDVPAGLIDGINYLDNNTVSLVLYAPNKESVLLIGDFNSWNLSNDYLMKKSLDGERYWLTVGGLTKGTEYAYQYFMDGKLKIADPYTEKILDPANDEGIPEITYPSLKTYPKGKTTGIVSILQTGQEPYPWKEIAFKPVPAEKLVIYEMLLRDFVATRDIKTVTDTLDYLASLGVNAIELMPVNEFEGNDSWGYNPSFYFAFDKYYGRKEDLQKFVEECHLRGIAVIIDMVLNHSYSQSPLVQMYFNNETNTVTSESPWFNKECPHSPWCWGYDFNHESQATKDFIDRVNRFWLTEFNVDGFRFDFTKGFTNTKSDGWNYDASRVAILKRMTDSIKAVKQDAYVIFEHLSENKEETELANYGILLWGKMTDKYNEATMGYNSGSKSDLADISYLKRGWDKPHLVGYMESHDEERLVYKNLTFGAVSDSYSTKDLKIALQRMETASAFFFTIPGPKMLWQFGELGYEFSINRCTDGTISDNCRLSPKPLVWDYLEDADRVRLKAVFSEIIKLRNSHEVFQTDDFNLDVGTALKRIQLNHSEMNVTILGNFDLKAGDIVPEFQHTGEWYNYFSGESIEVSDINASISLKAGEYIIFTDKQLERPGLPPGGELPSSIEGSESLLNKEFLVAPNPVNEIIRIYYKERDNSKVLFTLTNLAGQKVYENSYSLNGKGLIEINRRQLGNLNNGLLFYKIETNTDILSGKLILK